MHLRDSHTLGRFIWGTVFVAFASSSFASVDDPFNTTHCLSVLGHGESALRTGRSAKVLLAELGYTTLLPRESGVDNVVRFEYESDILNASPEFKREWALDVTPEALSQQSVVAISPGLLQLSGEFEKRGIALVDGVATGRRGKTGTPQLVPDSTPLYDVVLAQANFASLRAAATVLQQAYALRKPLGEIRLVLNMPARTGAVSALKYFQDPTTGGPMVGQIRKWLRAVLESRSTEAAAMVLTGTEFETREYTTDSRYVVEQDRISPRSTRRKDSSRMNRRQTRDIARLVDRDHVSSAAIMIILRGTDPSWLASTWDTFLWSLNEDWSSRPF